MGVSGLGWAVTIVLIAGLMLFDYVFQVRKTHVPTLREAAIWSATYIGIAVIFGVGVAVLGSPHMAVEYFAGYLSNEALSVDNLFVFLVIISSFAVPRVAQQKVLLFGIAFALIARTVFIILGGALLNSFNAVFYVFGLGLLVMAGKLAKPAETEDSNADNLVIRLANRFLRTSTEYDGDGLFVVQDGRRVMTPLLLVMIAVGGTDLLFAFDSVPAMFGLTQNIYLVFAATAFSLLGLRQLYFLIDNLLDRLVYLTYGLAVVLGFIGVKLILEALHDNNLPFINHGRPVPVVELSITVSLLVIVAVLLITTLVSLYSARGRRQNAVSRARRHANEYLASMQDPAQRDEAYAALLQAEREIDVLATKYNDKLRPDDELAELLRRVHEAHRDAD
ncbi:TerC/Alx family metal homeostasis membrane protein [Mycobacterium sp. TY815]|uniref:TerC/Alx family metal homeostasis membrane protein n=1 Tax=Mycobacterium sp. TY815 TaxID=3050581 RepID=UPI0027425342|nr:TerC/Alx family metal homeostasis membrane protein [Mycobacterium sp. TY815]MDP7702736.1 TerC/Alx family metal homeostasis membrane protein [Mycobacterium sp. TY815]